MIKMNINDFIYEVKEEMICYEEIGKDSVADWERNFNNWLNDGKKKKHIKGEGENKVYMLEDESEIFDIVDEYIQAIGENKISDYWKKFQ